jgi:peroxiredoxin
MGLEIGDEAPDFELRDQDGNSVKLSSFRGDKAVALVFYPFSFSEICDGELCQLSDDVAAYDDADVQVLAVSCDSWEVQRRWAEEKGWTFPVLSDFWPHGETAKAYGVFIDAIGCAGRMTFLVDKDGKLADQFGIEGIEGLGTARVKSRYKEALARLG